MPKRIVFDARESGTTTGRYMDKLVEYMHEENPPYEVLLLAKAKQFPFLQEIAPNFKLVETNHKEFTFAEQLGLKHQIEGLKPDLVHFPMVQQPILYRGKVVTTMQDLTTIRFRNPTKNPVVYWVKQQVYKVVNKIVARKSVALLAISEFVRQDVAQYCHVSPDKITVTLLSADLMADGPKPYEPMVGKDFIMYVGRPLPHKNLGRLIDAFEILQRSHPNLHLVLAGKKDGMYEIHEKNVQKRGIPNVVFTGFIEDAELRWLFENCKAYAFPSLSEGFGLPGLEAMKHGAPVVSSNFTSLPEVNGNAALYFDPLNVQDMAEKIGQVVDDPELRADLVKRGKEQAAKFSWERMAKQTLSVYKKALEN